MSCKISEHYYESKWSKYSDIPSLLVQAEYAANIHDIETQLNSIKKAVIIYEELLQEEYELLFHDYEAEYGWTLPALDWWREALKQKGKESCIIKHHSLD
jgi:hypothetical protein